MEGSFGIHTANVVTLRHVVHLKVIQMVHFKVIRVVHPFRCYHILIQVFLELSIFISVGIRLAVLLPQEQDAHIGFVPFFEIVG